MADKKISALTASSTPLAGTEVLPIVQSGATVKVSVANLTAGRAVAMSGITNTGSSDLGAQADSITLGGYTTRFSGASVTNNGTDWYGSYGRAIWNANASTTGGARRFAFVNGINYTAFGLLRSVDANTDPALGGNGGTVSSGTLDWSMDTSGNNTLHTGNLVIGTSGKGIDFSATSGAGTSELLADYEEGTWTPSDTSGAGLTLTITGTSTYTKIGRQVIATADITYPVTVDASLTLVGGLPFTSGAAPCGAGSIGYTDYGTWITASPSGSATAFRFIGATTFLTNAQLSGKRVQVCIAYIV
jgi:hypothetical protein